MKNVQISEELFVAIMRYFMLEQEELLPQIKQGLEKKLDAMVIGHYLHGEKCRIFLQDCAVWTV